ncbi:alpha-hydroxy-acid oxidizing protein [Erwiniaceae bacterium BAC15a-03b]|uniref:Alpha-hydroxy-acid oxidizing protein n=1 Tax=Winslowiella arboricola TaxID=2978220 RepID=A0A9J6PL22_9GAMM|nr:alpha-hydroxy acid oxidase [Winslowiella arboricola]MCU5772495.1 alpha-hydroxy-acid oxidizing protein [Winslowiella arboricola]MCU5779017.1 alpha-hydroxy-acid oxidizing protein [Winslowiella arboricola]
MKSLVRDYQLAARHCLPEGTFAYLAGGAEQENVLRRNQQALQSLTLAPRVLRDVSTVSTGVDFLGHQLRTPLLLAPVGSLHLIHPEAASGVAAAARRRGIAYAIGSALPDAEQHVAEGGDCGWFQLYINGDAQWLQEQCRAAQRRGYSGVILTVDVPLFPVRRRDAASANHAARRSQQIPPLFRRNFTWQGLQQLIAACPDIPFMVKGIQDQRDAQLACEAGVAAIYLSNHGGRQWDHGPAAIDLLAPVVRRVGGATRIIVDGGFASGSDVVKALALGADLVAIGRGYLYPYAAGGEALLTAWLEETEQEMITAMTLLGAADCAALKQIHHQALPVAEETIRWPD